VAVAINIPLMVALVGPMGIEGLALALSVSAVIEVIGLLWYLHRRLESIEGAAIAAAVARATAGAVVASVVMFAGLRAFEIAIPTLLADPIGRLVVLAVLVAAGGAAFVAVASVIRSPELAQFVVALRRMRRWGRAA
jgi:peptidoglycan biosynthesis protein MviN/MurJ (putative lipid II flippase)